MGSLSREAVILEGRKQTDGAARDYPRSLGQAVRARKFRLRQLIETASGLDQQPLVTEALEIDAGDAGGRKVACAGDAALTGNFEGTSFERRLGHEPNVTFPR